MRGVQILVLFLCIPNSLYSYRFICNGMNANGEERHDTCGPCDKEHAPRWDRGTLEVLVDSKTLPKGLSVEAWRSVVNESFSAWENVSGADLKFEAYFGINNREFGSNENNQEIFWITDRQEWRRLLGAGEYGTLGATLPRYMCLGDLGSYRQIFDADLVLNGLDHLQWQTHCEHSGCESIRTTLVHELGHFFGLDHPCEFCSSSVMSARAGLDISYPQFDDMEGLRALYPGSDTGGFGFPCSNNSYCNNLYSSCINDKGNQYCSKHCLEDSECPSGAICSKKSGFCKIGKGIEDGYARQKNLGESCNRSPCKDPLVCAGADEEHYYCFKPCDDNSACRENQACMPTVNGHSLCVEQKKRGQSCGYKALCEENLICVFNNLRTQGICREECTGYEQDLSSCPDNEVCTLFNSEMAICLPSKKDIFLGENNNKFQNDVALGGPIGDTHKNLNETNKNIFGCNVLGSNSNTAFGFLFCFVVFIRLCILLCKNRLLVK